MKFFISYSRSMKAQVGAVIRLLKAAGHEVWWDGDIPTIADWWATILEHIEQSEVVIFMISEKSVLSAYCMAELRYAIALNRPVLPFVLDDHSRYAMPSEFGRRQWFVHDGDPARMLGQINHDCGVIEWEKHRNRNAPRPPEPNSGSGSLIRQLHQAVNLAEAGRLGEAIIQFQNVASLDYRKWGAECEGWINRLQTYAEIAELADHPSTLKYARRDWDELVARDPEVVGFDPLLVLPRLVSNHNTPQPPVPVSPTPPPAAPVTPVRLSPVSSSRSAALLPAPFAWVPIPGKGYSIAKYPLTNAQYKLFVDAGGYQQPKWWTKAGWKQRKSEKWTEPRYWKDSQWNGAEQPVVGVSWYEAVAFCLWLSEASGEKIMLPTEDQWQYAAQGDDGRAFPWGNDWDGARCNNNVDSKGIGKTTPVRTYEGKGDSPFGVVDMAGNVSEWCLTDYEAKTIDIHSDAHLRVLRGGSWDNSNDSYNFRCVNRSRLYPRNKGFDWGFRLALS